VELATDLLRRGARGDADEAGDLLKRAAAVAGRLRMPAAGERTMMAQMAAVMPDELGRLLRGQQTGASEHNTAPRPSP
jgi:hypothetical protein